jgi:hypothetical protein
LRANGALRDAVRRRSYPSPPTVPFLRLAIILALTLAAGSCKSGTEPVGPCNTVVAVAATASATPEITWDPACGVVRVRVSVAVTDGATLWSIGSNASDVYPPIRYGVVPAGAVEVVAAEPLPPGTRPHVTLYDLNRNVAGQTQVQVP